MYTSPIGFSPLSLSVSHQTRYLSDKTFYSEAFATLCYGIEARKGFIVVTGEVEMGKTTLLRAVLQNLDSTVHTAFIFKIQNSFCPFFCYIFNIIWVKANRQRASHS